jgi:hypothetical protein
MLFIKNEFMKSTLALKILFALSLMVFFISCKKDKEAVEPDTKAAAISNVAVSKAVAYRGDSVEISFTAKDNVGLNSLKIEYAPWNFVKNVAFDGVLKTYTLKAKIPVPENAVFQVHPIKLTVTDMFNNVSTVNANLNVADKPAEYTEMYVYGDVTLAASLGKAWEKNYAEMMTFNPDLTFTINVYNYKTNGEFLFVSSRMNTSDVLGKSGADKAAKTSTTKFVLPTVGYYTILLNAVTLKYTVTPLTMPTAASNLWIVGQGLVEFNGNEWDPGNAIPMMSDPNNPNIFTKVVTRANDSEGVLKLLSAQNWGAEIGWTSILNVDDFANNDFSLTTSNRKFILINGHPNERYTIKVDRFLNKGIAVKL